MAEGRAAGRRVAQAAVVAAGLTIGAVGFAVLRGGDEAPGRASQPPSVSEFGFAAGPLAPVSVPTDPTVGPPGREPSSAEDALSTFLDALVAGDAERSLPLLDRAGRRLYPTPDSWIRSWADRPMPTSFTLGAARPAFGASGGAVEIEVAAEHRSSLDPVRGLVPARSRALWKVSREADGWRVGAEPVTFSPELPAEGTARAAVSSWVARLQACDPRGAVAHQAGSYLYGPSSLVEAPCQTQGTWTVGDPARLELARDPRDYVAAFGPGVSDWARAVPVDGPGRRFVAVVAPLGDGWAVMGVAVRS